MGLSVWAEADDVPGSICNDARLRGGKVTGISYPQGTSFGQAGWDVGLHFTNLTDLANKLTYDPVSTPKHLCGNWIFDCPPIKRGQVTRLGIHVHGEPGIIFFGGKKRPDLALTAGNLNKFHRDLHAIGLCTSNENATILILGCLAGRGDKGTRLLRELSRVWPGRKIVAFGTIGFVSGGMQKRPGDPCTEPGMRDTNTVLPPPSPKFEEDWYGKIWEDLERLPWASEHSPHAKVAFNGEIVRGQKF